ncbi:MAG: glycerol-3-phosphate 1-O-acyltransferase PlsY [Armatimonadetes bacterium]|nr:glycerol-3-phosphate 1-O-acyltransferase PlsY [Armatimonadota bacterium]
MDSAWLGPAMLAGGYILGGVPFGLLVARWISGIDVREHGSGNIGATNVYRTAGWRAALIVSLLDVGKGIAGALSAHAAGLHAGWQIAAGLAAVAGHSFSPFLRFRGGKGAATSLGVMMGIMWPVGTVALVLWAAVIACTGYVSLGTIVAALSLTPATVIIYPGDRERLVFAVGAAALTIARHRGNIRRLANGTESRFRRASRKGVSDDGAANADG